MKKILAIVLLVLSIISVFGCGSNNGGKKNAQADIVVSKSELDLFIPMAQHHKLDEKQLTKIVQYLKRIKMDFSRIEGMHSGFDYEVVEMRRTNNVMNDSFQAVVMFTKGGEGRVTVDCVRFRGGAGKYRGCPIVAEGNSIEHTLDVFVMNDKTKQELDSSLKQKLEEGGEKDVIITSSSYKYSSFAGINIEGEFTGTAKSNVYGSGGRKNIRGGCEADVATHKVTRTKSY